MSFSKILKRILEDKNISISQLANLMGTSRQYISEYTSEKANFPKLETLEKFSKVLGVSIDELQGKRINYDVSKLSEELHEITGTSSEKIENALINFIHKHGENGDLIFSIKKTDKRREKNKKKGAD